MGGFDQGWALGANLAAQHTARQQELADATRRQQTQDIVNIRNAGLAKLPEIKDLYGEDSQQYKDLYQTVTKSQYDLGQIWHPDKAPGALQRNWHWLLEKAHGITAPKDKTPQSTTIQAPEATLNTPAAPIVTPELPAYQQTTPALPSQGGSVTTTQPGVSASTLPGMGGLVTLPAGSPVTVTKAPAPSWGQAQVLKQKAASMQKAQDEAKLLASASPLSPQEQALSEQRTDDVVRDAQIESTMRIAKNLGLSDTALDELKQQMVGLKNVTPKPLTGAAGQPYLGPDGLYRQAVSNPDGTIGFRQMPPDWKPNTKAISGTIINTKQHGWIKTWVDPYNPSKVIGYQKITPGRQYAGSTSTSSSTDPFGLTTSSSRTTMPTTSAPVDMDLSGIQELPDNYNGEDIPTPQTSDGQSSAGATSSGGSPNKSPVPTANPPKSVAKPSTTPAQLKTRVPAPPQNLGAPLALDSNGHIPAGAPYNQYLIGAANDILDGKDIDKMPIPLKDKEAAENIARQYGWGGQGMFTPTQKLQIREASTFLNEAVNSKALSVLDSPTSRLKLIAAINNSEGHAGFIDATAAKLLNLNPQEAEFLRMYRQLTGTISGLASLTRPGRPTEAGIKRLMFELPNPNESHSAADAKERLKRLIKEIDIATKKGNADDLFGGTGSSGASNSGALTADQFRGKYLTPKTSPQ